MITLYTFGRMFGLPDPSPFCMKGEVLLKMAGRPFKLDHSGFRRAPKGKQPYIEDDGAVVADTTFIRWHLEQKYGIDFDKGLPAADKAVAWAFEKLCEDNLYFGLVHARWMNDSNFDKGPRRYFDEAPAPIRPLIVAKVRRDVRGTLKGQGLGRHSNAEIDRLAIHGIDALADFLADKPYLMGAMPCGADATVFAFVASLLCPLFETPMRTAAEKRANLVAYNARCMQRFYPEFPSAKVA